MKKLNFDEVLEKLANDRSVRDDEVLERAKSRRVVVASNGLPGCLSDSFAIYTTKADAIDHFVHMFNCSDEPMPAGMKTGLKKFGRFVKDGYIYRIEEQSLRDMLA